MDFIFLKDKKVLSIFDFFNFTTLKKLSANRELFWASKVCKPSKIVLIVLSICIDNFSMSRGKSAYALGHLPFFKKYERKNREIFTWWRESDFSNLYPSLIEEN